MDYAAKQWNGLIRDYYYPRWKLFFDKLDQVLMDPYLYSYNQTLFEQLATLEIGNGFIYGQHEYPDIPHGDSILLAEKIHTKWRHFGPEFKPNFQVVIDVI